jgi:hypothetical protein
MLQNPNYQNAPDVMKAKAIQDVITQYRDAAQQMFLIAHPDFLQQTLQKKVPNLAAARQ